MLWGDVIRVYGGDDFVCCLIKLEFLIEKNMVLGIW